MIAALFVEKNGVYFGLPNVDPWDEERDAMKYPGPYPVIAHPPCTVYCVMSNCRPEIKKRSDGGAFQFALNAVRKYGGLLEQPAFSTAFRKHGIPDPKTGFGWQRVIDGGYVCYVEQGRYGHRARKGTWLYAFGVDPVRFERRIDTSVIRGKWNQKNAGKLHLKKRESLHTPIQFRDLLISIVETVKQPEEP